jgi:hypothetical protein
MLNGLRRFLPSHRHLKILGLILLPIILFLSWLVFWPWDDPPPEDADLRFPERPKIAAVDNAYTYFIQTEKKFKYKVAGPDGVEKYFSNVDLTLSSDAFDPGLAEAFLKANADSLLLMEKAFACPAWEYPEADMPWIAKRCCDLRDRQKLLQMKVKWELLMGNLETAAAILFQEMHFSLLMLNSQSDRWMFSVAYTSWDMNNSLAMAWDPKTPDTILMTLEANLAKFDNQLLTNAYRDAMRREYWDCVEAFKIPGVRREIFINFVYGDQPRNPLFVAPYCFKPNKTLRMIVDGQQVFIANAGLPYTEFKKRMLPETPFRYDKDRRRMVFKPNGLGQMVYENICTRHDSFGGTGLRRWEGACRNLASAAAIRLTIACKRHERKYGKLPETLEALVPEFIATVPTDPFDGKPMRYSRERRLVWSVGSDGGDNEGRMPSYQIHLLAILVDEKGYDLVCPIDRPPPKPPK